MPGRYILDDRVERRVLPALLAAGGERAGEVRCAGADHDHVGRPAMLHLIDLELAFVDQADRNAVTGLPAQFHGEHRALGRQGKLPIAIVEFQIELVGVAAALLGDAQADQPRPDFG